MLQKIQGTRSLYFPQNPGDFSRPTLLELPQELLSKIISFLPSWKDLTSLSCVDQFFRRTVVHASNYQEPLVARQWITSLIHSLDSEKFLGSIHQLQEILPYTKTQDGEHLIDLKAHLLQIKYKCLQALKKLPLETLVDLKSQSYPPCKSMKNLFESAEILASIYKTLASVHEIENEQEKTTVLSIIIERFRKANDLEGAAEAALQLPESNNKSMILWDLVCDLATLGHITQATDLAHEISAEPLKWFVLRHVATTAVLHGDSLYHALDIVNGIEDDIDRGLGLCDLALEFTKSKEVATAIQTATEIPSLSCRINTFQNMIEILKEPNLPQ